MNPLLRLETAHVPLNVHPSELSTKVPYREPIIIAAWTVVTVGTSISASNKILVLWLNQSPAIPSGGAEYRLTPLSILINDAKANMA